MAGSADRRATCSTGRGLEVPPLGQLRRVRRHALLEVVYGIWSRRIPGVQRESPLRPPERLGPVLRLLLADCHLPVGLEQRHLAELVQQRVPDAVHLGVVKRAGVVVLGQSRRERVTRTVEPFLQFAEDEVAVDRIRVLLKESAEAADGGDRIARESLQPGQIVGVVLPVGQQSVGQASPHGRPHRRRRRRNDRRDAEVRRIVRQPNAQETWPVVPDAAADDDTPQRDRLSFLGLEREETGTVRLRVFAGEVTDPPPVDPHRDRVRVVGVVTLGDENRLNLLADTFHGSPAHGTPEGVLVVALADDLQVVTSAVENDIQARCRRARRGAAGRRS